MNKKRTILNILFGVGMLLSGKQTFAFSINFNAIKTDLFKAWSCSKSYVKKSSCSVINSFYKTRPGRYVEKKTKPVKSKISKFKNSIAVKHFMKNDKIQGLRYSSCGFAGSAVFNKVPFLRFGRGGILQHSLFACVGFLYYKSQKNNMLLKAANKKLDRVIIGQEENSNKLNIANKGIKKTNYSLKDVKGQVSDIWSALPKKSKKYASEEDSDI